MVAEALAEAQRYMAPDDRRMINAHVAGQFLRELKEAGLASLVRVGFWKLA